MLRPQARHGGKADAGLSRHQDMGVQGVQAVRRAIRFLRNCWRLKSISRAVWIDHFEQVEARYWP